MTSRFRAQHSQFCISLTSVLPVAQVHSVGPCLLLPSAGMLALARADSAKSLLIRAGSFYYMAPQQSRECTKLKMVLPALKQYTVSETLNVWQAWSPPQLQTQLSFLGRISRHLSNAGILSDPAALRAARISGTNLDEFPFSPSSHPLAASEQFVQVLPPAPVCSMPCCIQCGMGPVI